MGDQVVSRRNFMVRTIIGIMAFIGAVLAVPFARIDHAEGDAAG